MRLPIEYEEITTKETHSEKITWNKALIVNENSKNRMNVWNDPINMKMSFEFTLSICNLEKIN